MDNIEKMQYENLRKCFSNNIIDPILGKNYYNLALDVYECDRMTSEDVRDKFIELHKKSIFYKNLAIINSVIGIMTFILLIIFK